MVQPSNMQNESTNRGSEPDPYAANQQRVYDYRNLGQAPVAPRSPAVEITFGGTGAPAAVPVAMHGVQYAAFLARFAAFLIDFAILAVGLGVLWMFVTLATVLPGLVLGNDGGAILGFLLFLIAFPFAFLWPIFYHVKLETGPGQGTLGKQLMGMRVVSLEGNTLTKRQSVGRLLVRYLLSFAFFGMGYLLALFTERKQTLHDLLMSTIVVRR